MYVTYVLNVCVYVRRVCCGIYVYCLYVGNVTYEYYNVCAYVTLRMFCSWYVCSYVCTLCMYILYERNVCVYDMYVIFVGM